MKFPIAPPPQAASRGAVSTVLHQPWRLSKGLELELSAHLQAETATPTPPRPNSRGTTDDVRRLRPNSLRTTVRDECRGLTAKA